jgi:hypothetical protein
MDTEIGTAAGIGSAVGRANSTSGTFCRPGPNGDQFGSGGRTTGRTVPIATVAQSRLTAVQTRERPGREATGTR